MLYLSEDNCLLRIIQDIIYLTGNDIKSSVNERMNNSAETAKSNIRKRTHVFILTEIQPITL